MSWIEHGPTTTAHLLSSLLSISANSFLELNTVIGRKDDLEKKFSACKGGIRILKEGWETEAIPEIKIKRIEKEGF